ncbi:hypothetical protein CCR75_003493 [Bremia lactucae]|uniref:Uncharacterized protein n=1 Tax=Bremia lactucae TaxID=4779 RepID=A0A976FR62_BRELC|nr:hypothetical protein CCR75_003493 [Bremia lactucae]
MPYRVVLRSYRTLVHVASPVSQPKLSNPFSFLYRNATAKILSMEWLQHFILIHGKVFGLEF